MDLLSGHNSWHNDLHDMLENINILPKNETERLLSWRGGGLFWPRQLPLELVCPLFPEVNYVEKCFDFDCIKVEQIILIFRGTQRRFPPSCIGNTF